MSYGLMGGLEVENKFLHGSNKDMIFNQATLQFLIVCDHCLKNK